MNKVVRLSGEVTGIQKIGDTDRITVCAQSSELPMVTREMTLQIPHEEGNEALFRTPMRLIAFLGEEDEEQDG